MKLIPTPFNLTSQAKNIARVMSLENANIVNIQLKKGETIVEHDSSRDVVIVVRRGSVIFDVKGTETLITKDNVFYMKPFERHSLRAPEDTDLLVFQIMP